MVKPSRKQWIYGRRGTAKQIHFPPVVPHIPPALLDDIVDVYVQASRSSTANLESNRVAMQNVIRQLERKISLTPVERRRLHQQRKELEKIEATLRQGNAQLEQRARNEALNLCLRRGIREVSVIEDEETRRPKLVLVTAPVKIGKALLGTYDVYLDPSLTIPSKAFFLVRRDYTRRQGPHPHWFTYGCLGTWGPMLEKMLRHKSWMAAIGGFLNYLATYYGQSPLLNLSEFYPGGYYENKHPLN
jgi:hypothetical protein